MDNEKTGRFIKERRSETGLTQKELAEMLHITDRAVSKWERGLSAPGIALLEPLAEALGVTVTDIIRGEKSVEAEPGKDVTAGDVIAYAVKEFKIKMKRAMKRIIAVAAAIALVIAGAYVIHLWRHGHFSVVWRSVSPDGKREITVYNRDWKFDKSIIREECTFVVTKDGGGESYSTWGKMKCSRIEWSPDSKECLLTFQGSQANPNRHEMFDFENGSVTELDVLIKDGIESTERSINGYECDAAKDENLCFSSVRWMYDRDIMAFCYFFTDEIGNLHKGEFLLNYGSYVCTPQNADILAPDDQNE